LRDTIRKILREELGVPTNIISFSKELYSDLISEMDNNISIVELQNYTIEYHEIKKILDIPIKRVTVELNLVLNDDYFKNVHLISLGVYSSMSIDDSSKTDRMTVDSPMGVMNIEIKLGCPEDAIPSDVLSFFIEGKPKLISTLTHETKHFVDFQKHKYEKISSRIKYNLPSEFGVNIKPLQNFMFLIYYFNEIENRVRPSELAALIETNNITKQDFLKYLKSTDIYKRITEANELSLEKLKQELVTDHYSDIVKLMRSIGIKNPNGNPTIVVDLFLDSIFKYTKVHMVNRYREISGYHEFFDLFSLMGIPETHNNKKKWVSKFQGELNKIKDFDHFFELERKKITFASQKLLKKLSKLYHMAKDNPKKSIVDFDIHHKINKTDEKTRKFMEENKHLLQNKKTTK